MMGRKNTTKKKSRIPAVVPRLVFSTIFVGVIPACVVSACSGGVLSGGPSEAGLDGRLNGDVANQCFGNPGCQQGVAAVAFQCFDGSVDPRCPRGVADAAFGDADGEGGDDGADGAG